MPFNKQTQCYLVFAKPSFTLPILVEEYQIMVNRPFNICLVIFRFNLDGFIHKKDARLIWVNVLRVIFCTKGYHMCVTERYRLFKDTSKIILK